MWNNTTSVFLDLLYVAKLHSDGSWSLHSADHSEHADATQVERNGKRERKRTRNPGRKKQQQVTYFSFYLSFEVSVIFLCSYLIFIYAE